jgi:autotransporter-associated beta strand protein
MKILAPSIRRPLIGAIAATFVTSVAIHAATFLWDGGGLNDNISTAANWNPNTAPSSAAASTILSFAGTTRLAPVQDFAGGMIVQGLQFTNTAGPFTVSGSKFIFQTGAAAPTIDVAGSNGIIITAPLQLDNNLTFTGGGLAQLTLSGPVSGVGNLTKSSLGLLAVTGSISNPNIFVNTGTFRMAAGSSSTNAQIQVNSGASFELTGGTVNTGAGAFFQIGNSAGATAATAALNAGSVTSTESDIGNVAGATGTVTQDGASHTVTGRLYLGVNATSTGNYTLNSGTLTTAGTTVGHFGVGTFTQNGGTHDSSTALLLGANGASAGGTYNLNGGTLIVTTIGNNGNSTSNATFNFNGGTLKARASVTNFITQLTAANVQAGGAIIDSNNLAVTIPQPLIHAAALGATADGGLIKIGVGTLKLSGANTYTGATQVDAGTLELPAGGSLTNTFVQVKSGGTFLVSGGAYDTGAATYLNVGISAGLAPAVMTQTGGTVTTVATDVGNTTGGTAIYNLSGGTHSVSVQMTVGLGAGATGTYNLSGTGVLNAPGQILIGINGTGTLNQTGGTLTSPKTQVGNASNGTGTILLSGGQFNSTTFLLLGAAGPAHMQQSGGTVTTNELSVGFAAGIPGDYVLSGGTINTPAMEVGYSGLGTMVQTGGVLNATVRLEIGSQTGGVGTFRLQGGTLRTPLIRSLAGDGTLIFDGGTIQAPATIANLFSAVDTLSVAGGGARIDTNGFSVAIASALQHDASDTGGFGTDGGLTKLGAGTLTLSGASTFNGGVTVSAGTLSVTSDSNLGGANRPVTIDNGASLVLNSASFTTVGRTFNLNNAALTPIANGTLIFNTTTINGGFLRSNGTSTHRLDGGTALNYTTILPGTAVAQQSGTATLTGVTLSGALTQSGGTLNFNNGYVSAAGSVTAAGTMNTNGVEIAGRLTVTGTVIDSVAPLVFGYGAQATVSASGVLTANAGTSLELNGARLNNSGDQNGALNINDGSVVTGTGTFGIVTVNTGGTFSPGNSPGTSNLDGLSLAAGGSYNFELNSTVVNPGVNQDFLNIAGQFNINGTAGNPIILTLSTLLPNNNPGPLSNFPTNVPYSFTLATAAGGIVGFAAGKFAIDTSHFLNGLDGGTFALAQSGDQKSLLLSFTPIPEPATMALLFAGLPLIAMRRRRSEKRRNGRATAQQTT